MEIKHIRRSHQTKIDPVKAKDKMDALRKEHNKLVKGTFEFIDAQGGFLEFNYRFFPEDLLVTYKLVHGETCEMPLGLVKHLNNTKKKVRNFGMSNGAQRGNELPHRGLPSTFETVSRVRFTPVEVF